MLLLLRNPIFKKPDLLSYPLQVYCAGCTNISQIRGVYSGTSRKQRSLQKKTDDDNTESLKPSRKKKVVRSKLSSPESVTHDLRFDSAPVLFIKKYKEVIDTQDLIFKVIFLIGHVFL